MTRFFSNEALLAGAMHEAGIKHIVYTGNSSNSALFGILQRVPDLTLLRAIDERNAAYYAMGVAIETQSPVAVIASDGAAASNYLPAATEAYYQNLPLLMIEERSSGMDELWPSTSDAFNTVAGCVLTLSDAHSDADVRKNAVDICHAISTLENNIQGKTPVYISYFRSASASTEYMPVKDFIRGISLYTDSSVWSKMASELQESKGIALVVEDSADASKEVLLSFAQHFNCCVVTDWPSNTAGINGLSISKLLTSQNVDMSAFEHIITLSRSSSGRLEKLFKREVISHIKHWHVAPDGFFYDPFEKLVSVFSVCADYFMRSMMTICAPSKACKVPDIKTGSTKNNSNELVRLIQSLDSKAGNGNMYFSVRSSSAVLDSAKLTVGRQLLSASADTVTTGCLSQFLGFACNNPRECYLIIDDESFFKDINALATRHVGSNIHILLIDTGAVSHMSYSGSIAEPHAVFALNAWTKDTGFFFIDADNAADGIANMDSFAAHQEAPVLMRVPVHLV